MIVPIFINITDRTIEKKLLQLEFRMEGTNWNWNQYRWSQDNQKTNLYIDY